MYKMFHSRRAAYEGNRNQVRGITKVCFITNHIFSAIYMAYGLCQTGGGFLTYIRTKLHKEIQIESIITLHYFEYMKNFSPA